MSKSLSLWASSRRTVMSGEVVTFATSFYSEPGAFGTMYKARGPFDLSASRDAVIVHRAELKSELDFLVFQVAAEAAKVAFERLQSTHRGGAASFYADEPFLWGLA